MPGHEDIYIERLEVLNGSCFYHFKKFLTPLKLLMVSSFLGGCFYRYLVMITCLLMVLFSWLDGKLYWRQDICSYYVFLMYLSLRAILPAHCLFVDLFCGHWGNEAFKIEFFLKSWFPKEKIICMSSGKFHKKIGVCYKFPSSLMWILEASEILWLIIVAQKGLNWHIYICIFFSWRIWFDHFSHRTFFHE